MQPARLTGSLSLHIQVRSHAAKVLLHQRFVIFCFAERAPDKIADVWRAAFQDAAAAAAAPSGKPLANGWHDARNDARPPVGAQPSLADLASANPLYDDPGSGSHVTRCGYLSLTPPGVVTHRIDSTVLDQRNELRVPRRQVRQCLQYGHSQPPWIKSLSSDGDAVLAADSLVDESPGCKSTSLG